MKTVKVTMAVVIVVVGTLALGQASKKAAGPLGVNKVLTGVVSDSMCGPKHMMKNKSSAECTRECVKGGSDYALVVGNTVYALEGNKTEIDKYAGNKVTVTGRVTGNKIAVDSITAVEKKKSAT